ncbi:MAG: hypothetical protein ACE5K7_07525, partial [Phycisphaerae bacterium]
QSAVLEAYRRSRQEAELVGQFPAPSWVVTEVAWGRVSAVVSSDPQYGPHLMVQPQEFVGSPPSPTDAGSSAVRCYPAPNRTVQDYSVDEYVKIVAGRGAFIADKSA